jgi:hypothetical protein
MRPTLAKRAAVAGKAMGKEKANPTVLIII